MPTKVLYPAIDIKDGSCVRLVRGEMDQATHYGDDPSLQALVFARQGAEYLHLVDLNGAFAGHSVNKEVIRKIRRAVAVPCQLGGGIRKMEDIELWLGEGMDRVILGSVAVKDPDLAMAAILRYPGRIVLGLDTRAGKLATQGWAEQSDIDVVTFAKKFTGAGLAAIIHTDIDRDGIKTGLNLSASEALAQASGIPVIASGGCRSLDDIRDLKKSHLAGAILGRALYDGSIKLRDAIEYMSHAED